jgi:predicted RNase H-like HicB family nuclease
MTHHAQADPGPVSLTLTALFEPDEDGWFHASLPALPGVLTSAPSQDEARAMFADALREYLLSLDAEHARAETHPPDDVLAVTIASAPDDTARVAGRSED